MVCFFYFLFTFFLFCFLFLKFRQNYRLTNLVYLGDFVFSPFRIVIVVPLFALAQWPVLTLVWRRRRGRRAALSTVALLMIRRRATLVLQHLVNLLLCLVDLAHRIWRVTSVAVSVSRRATSVAEVPPVPEIVPIVLIVAEVSAAIVVVHPAAAILKVAAAPVLKAAASVIVAIVVVLIVEIAIPVLKVTTAAAAAIVVEVLKARLVVGTAIVVVRAELTPPVVATVAGPTSTATARVGARSWPWAGPSVAAAGWSAVLALVAVGTSVGVRARAGASGRAGPRGPRARATAWPAARALSHAIAAVSLLSRGPRVGIALLWRLVLVRVTLRVSSVTFAQIRRLHAPRNASWGLRWMCWNNLWSTRLRVHALLGNLALHLLANVQRLFEGSSLHLLLQLVVVVLVTVQFHFLLCLQLLPLLRVYVLLPKSEK